MSNIIIPEGQDKQSREMMEAVALGVEAREFLNSTLAKYIVNSAELKVETAKEKLAFIDPTSSGKIEEIQRIIRIYKHFHQSLVELVIAGDSAYQLYLRNLEMEQG